MTRRDFVAAAGTATAAMALNPIEHTAEQAEQHARTDAGGTVLFQGDSITDGGRSRERTAANADGALGNGYPLLIAAPLLREAPTAGWRFLNRGISGNRVPDLQVRWHADTIALAPDILSVLIGVNDYWHARDGNASGTVADYEREFTTLLEGTRAALPTLRILVLEPFVLRTGFVDDSWFPEFDARRAAARRVATRTGSTFIGLQDRFNAAAMETGPEYWAADGVHPSPAGHALIAEALNKEIRK
ncbi:MAG TPA: GDSL-type esterase/lipase family protein [Gemmatimonadaceae bacterium]|nr:GDSL-type esterase/lipase family protein [Gemmatimonadaceae bacterium]